MLSQGDNNLCGSISGDNKRLGLITCAGPELGQEATEDVNITRAYNTTK